MEAPIWGIGFGFNNPAFSDRILRIEIIKECFDSLPSEDSHHQNVVEVKTLHVSSLILAASSSFFYRLFQNGMRESREKEVTLRISESEYEALMHALRFLYTNILTPSPTDLLGVLMVADKFELRTCMRHSSLLLLKMPMSLESALQYLDLPTSIIHSVVVQPLILEAKKFLVKRYSDFNKCKQELMGVPLCAVEAILESGGLKVKHEDSVFDFVLEWSRAHYPELEKRRKILTDSLVRYIRFPYMSCPELKKVLACPDFDHEQVSKLVLEALFLKSEVPRLGCSRATKDTATTNVISSLGLRTYKHRPIQVVYVEFSKPRCIVYFDVKKEECGSLNRSKDLTLRSQSFRLGGRRFYLVVKCTTKEGLRTFGLYLKMTKEGTACTLEKEFAVLNKSSNEFERKRSRSKIHHTQQSRSKGYVDLFGIPWADLMSTINRYFINGVLHIRADVTVCT